MATNGAKKAKMLPLYSQFVTALNWVFAWTNTKTDVPLHQEFLGSSCTIFLRFLSLVVCCPIFVMPKHYINFKIDVIPYSLACKCCQVNYPHTALFPKGLSCYNIVEHLPWDFKASLLFSFSILYLPLFLMQLYFLNKLAYLLFS